MARVIYGPSVSTLHGSIRGTTFQDNASGSIARGRSHPSLFPSPGQSYQQTWAGQVNKAWQGLSLVQQLSWDTFAGLHTKQNRYGQTKTLTGFNWFSSLNYFHYFHGYALLSTAPAHVLPTTPAPYSVNTNAATLDITFAPAFNPANSDLYIFTTSASRATTGSVRSGLRFTKFDTASPFGVIDLTAGWSDAHGCAWADAYTSGVWRLWVMVMTVEKASYITSSGLLQSGSVP